MVWHRKWLSSEMEGSELEVVIGQLLPELGTPASDQD